MNWNNSKLFRGSRGFRRSLPAVIGAIALVVSRVPASRAESILNSKHNLSVGGSGDIKAATESDVCIFCHTPHKSVGGAPLWNRENSTASYTPYSSTTVKATIGQPTGSSRLCLSCHDGTIALGLVHSRATPIAMQNGVTTMPAGSANLGTDLSDDHPISFHYDSALVSADGELKDPATLTGKVKLDKGGDLQCTSCHDPHDNQFGKFLVQANNGSALCINCHDKAGWNTSTHHTSTATWNGQGSNPWPHTSATTVADNACESCHAPHSAGTKQRLLNFSDEEKNCFTCHSGNVAARNIQTEFNKFSAHPILSTTGVHDPAEDPINPARHVECADCHNPHAANASGATAPNASGALAKVKGVNAAGGVVQAVTKEYELCFRCHADSTARGPSHVPRQFPETNKRLQFSASNASFHPVEGQGKSSNVPSLLSPYTTASTIYCTDCHNNDQGPGAGGAGPKGPHGSVYEPLLERQLALTDFNAESSGSYALCYKCHNRSSILNNESFNAHYLHVVVAQAACTTCHDSHGVAGQGGLINFNTTYATASSNGRLEFVKAGTFSGNCSVSCHGKDHNAQVYAPNIIINTTRSAPPAQMRPGR